MDGGRKPIRRRHGITYCYLSNCVRCSALEVMETIWKTMPCHISLFRKSLCLMIAKIGNWFPRLSLAPRNGRFLQVIAVISLAMFSPSRGRIGFHGSFVYGNHGNQFPGSPYISELGCC